MLGDTANHVLPKGGTVFRDGLSHKNVKKNTMMEDNQDTGPENLT